jgi:Ulp1 protease family, C-terminal catalytic domain
VTNCNSLETGQTEKSNEFKSLEPGVWLDDLVMNAFGRALEVSLLAYNVGARFINTHAILDLGVTSAAPRYWSARKPPALPAHLTLFCLHWQNHWTSAVIKRTGNNIVLWHSDSLGCVPVATRITPKVAELMLHSAGYPEKASRMLNVVEVTRFPRQQNLDDCGVYACLSLAAAAADFLEPPVNFGCDAQAWHELGREMVKECVMAGKVRFKPLAQKLMPKEQ